MGLIENLKKVEELVKEIRSEISYSDLGGYERYLVAKNVLDLETSSDQLIELFSKLNKKTQVIEGEFKEKK